MFADKIKKMANMKELDIEIENNLINLKKEWELKINEFIALTFDELKKDLEQAVLKGEIKTEKKKFTVKRYVQAYTHFGAKHFCSQTWDILNDLCKKEQYKRALSSLTDKELSKLRNSYDDAYIAKKILSLCEEEGIIAECSTGESYGITTYSIYARVEL